MELKEAIETRYSIRKFQEKEVSMDIIAKILNHARLAPSSGNTQCWKFIMVTDPKKRAEIAKACLEQHWIAAAPVLIVVCNQYSKVTSLYGKLGEIFSIQDCSIISSYIQLLAVDYGLGSCWVGAFEGSSIKSILGIPEDVNPDIILALGYPIEEERSRIRSEIEYLSYFDKWGNKAFNQKKGVLKIAKEYFKGKK